MVAGTTRGIAHAASDSPKAARRKTGEKPMREDVVTPATARRLQRAGLVWEPQPGDWCVALGGAHLGEAQSGLWLVAVVAQGPGLLGLLDTAGQWPMVRVPMRDCVWLPSAGKLKTWLRGRGYRVATREADPIALGSGVRHLCRLTSAAATDPIMDGEGPSEAEAVAEATLRVLAAAMRAPEDGPTPNAGAPDTWISVPDSVTRKL
jgi:hypothetical protein